MNGVTFPLLQGFWNSKNLARKLNKTCVTQVKTQKVISGQVYAAMTRVDVQDFWDAEKELLGREEWEFQHSSAGQEELR